MAKPLFIGFNAAYIICYALLAQAFGIASQSITFPTTITAPEDGSILDQIIAPFVWAWDALGAIAGMIGYAFIGVDFTVYSIAIVALFVIDFLIIIGIIRGGGT